MNSPFPCQSETEYQFEPFNELANFLFEESMSSLDAHYRAQPSPLLSPRPANLDEMLNLQP